MNRESKRDFLYSVLSVLSFPVLSRLYGKNLQSLSSWESESSSVAVMIVVLEIMKILVTTFMFPSPGYIFDGKNGGLTGSGRGTRLPFSKGDKIFIPTEGNESSLSISLRLRAVGLKVLEIVKGVPNLIAGVIVGHIVFILFGASVFEKWKLTLEFSVMLVVSLYFPLTFVIHPSVVLQELMYISSWRDKNVSLSFAKWRFLLTLFGAWVGTVVIPLDWDRPWQQWPIPCIVSSFLSIAIINLVCSVVLLTMTVLKTPTGSSDVGAASVKSPTKNKSKYF